MDVDIISALEKKYPYVDSALILALTSDDGLNGCQPTEQLETLLAQVNQDAKVLGSLGELEETSSKEKQEIDAILEELQHQQNQVDGQLDTMSKVSSLGSFGSLSSDLDSLSLDESVDENYKQNLAFLRQSFPTLPLVVIRTKLISTKNDVSKAIDLLLNNEVLDQVEAEAHYASYGTKKKMRIRNRDKKTAHDNVQLQFVSELLGISIEEAATRYEDNDRSIAKILATENAVKGTVIPISTASTGNAWKRTASPALSTASISGTTSSIKSSSTLCLTKGSNTQNACCKGSNSTLCTTIPSRPNSAPVCTHKNVQIYNCSSCSPTEQYDLGQSSFAKAREMYRKGKSNPLYGGAVSYYSETGKGHMQKYKEAQESIEHESLQRQSTPYMIDFHGISSKVASEACIAKLEEWWTREEHGAGRIMPLKLITGSGRHSAAGIPKIKNLIRKILKDNGWKYEEYSGFFLVNGVTK